MDKQNRHPQDRLIRYSLSFLLFLLALNAFAGGYYGMAGAENVPVRWLNDSPFHNYFIPGLVLFTCVGGSALYATISVFMQLQRARKAALISGITTLFWLTVQVAIIGYVSWMQPATAIVVLLILFLTSKLPKYGR